MLALKHDAGWRDDTAVSRDETIGYVQHRLAEQVGSDLSYT